MGQKVNPHGLRVGVIKNWDSMWYAEGDFADNLVEDYKIRKFLKNKLYNAGVSRKEHHDMKKNLILLSAWAMLLAGCGGSANNGYVAEPHSRILGGVARKSQNTRPMVYRNGVVIDTLPITELQ